MKKKYESEILEVLHKDMKGLHRLGIVSDAEMQEFDSECLVQEPKKIRKNASSQARSIGTRRSVRISAKGTGS